MELIIKEILYWIALGSGSIILVCLFVAGMIKAICILLDHLKVANVLRKALLLYIKTNRKDLKIKEEDINIGKQRIERMKNE